ncbi:MAG: hypothetical protein CVU84_06275 [Firmicutes bacterium HGW-Firmicutes-1]|jgi:hypothetical protein|nr:MAG: hypothetical protein CVU84_06275 [Firmicutes bacterium HGW-Firmicutes-1]
MLQVNKTKRHKRIKELLDMYNRVGIYKDEITSLDYIQGQLILVVSWECLKCSNCYLYGGKCGTKVTTVPCLFSKRDNVR